MLSQTQQSPLTRGLPTATGGVGVPSSSCPQPCCSTHPVPSCLAEGTCLAERDQGCLIPSLAPFVAKIIPSGLGGERAPCHSVTQPACGHRWSASVREQARTRPSGLSPTTPCCSTPGPQGPGHPLCTGSRTAAPCSKPNTRPGQHTQRTGPVVLPPQLSGTVPNKLAGS